MDIMLCPLQWSPLEAGGEVDLGEAIPLLGGEEEVVVGGGGVKAVVEEEVGVVLAEEGEEGENEAEAEEVVAEEAVAVVLVEEGVEGETHLPGIICRTVCVFALIYLAPMVKPHLNSYAWAKKAITRVEK